MKNFYYSNEPLNDVVLGPSVGQFSTWSLDGMAVVWDMASGKHLQEFYAGDYMEICAPSFSAHKRLMTTAAHGHEALVWNIATRTKVATLMGHTDIVRISKFCPVEDLIATASYDGTIKLWKGPGFPYPDPFREPDSLNAYNGEVIADPMGLHLPVLRFDQSQHHLRHENRELLRRVAKIMKDHPDLEIVIEGHTDNVGYAHKNDRLSHRRAVVVAHFLEQEGISSHRLQYEGHGSDKPTHLNTSEESKSYNRRVEIKFVRP